MNCQLRRPLYILYRNGERAVTYSDKGRAEAGLAFFRGLYPAHCWTLAES